MIKLKQIGLPVDGTTWSYGADRMRQISIRDARGLCGMYPLPRMGEETIVAIKPDPTFSTFKLRLMVQNIAGQYFIASTDAKVCDWPAVFGVEVIEPAPVVAAHVTYESHQFTSPTKGAARLTYRDDWSKETPWVKYVNGTAGMHFATLADGVAWMTANGFKAVKV